MVHAVILPIRATSPGHLNLTDLITTVILGGQYTSLIASLRGFLQCPVTSSLVCPYVLLGTLFSKTRHNHVLILTKTDHVSNPEKATSKYSPFSLSLSSLGLWLCKRKTVCRKVAGIFGMLTFRYFWHVNFYLWPCTASGASKNLRTGPSDFRRGSQDTRVGWVIWTAAALNRSCHSEVTNWRLQMGPSSAKIVVWHLVRPFVRLACVDHRQIQKPSPTALSCGVSIFFFACL